MTGAVPPSQFSLRVQDIVGEELARQFRAFYSNQAHVRGADWSLDVTEVVQKVLGKDNVFRAIIYGKYPRRLNYSGNPNRGNYASLMPGQYCPAHPEDALDEKIFVRKLQDKVFVVKLYAYGRWWWAGIPCTLQIIKPTPFRVISWKAVPRARGTIRAGSTIPIEVDIKFQWGTGQRSVAFRVQFDLIGGNGEIIATEMSRIFLITRMDDMPRTQSVKLQAQLKLPEDLLPGAYTINATLFYTVP